MIGTDNMLFIKITFLKLHLNFQKRQHLCGSDFDHLLQLLCVLFLFFGFASPDYEQ